MQESFLSNLKDAFWEKQKHPEKEPAVTVTPQQAAESSNKIILVYDKKNENAAMAELLAGKILQSGVYTAVVKTKSEYELFRYENDLLNNTAEQPIIIIGNIYTDLLKQIKWKYDDFGMKYGWHKNEAILLVEKKKLNEAELTQFKKIIDKEPKAEKTNDFLQKSMEQLDKLPKEVKMVVVMGRSVVANMLNKGEDIFVCQQTYLVNKFFSETLEEFLKAI